MRMIASVACLLFVAGCNGSSPTTQDQKPSLDQPFQLKVGESATIENGQLAFVFESVPSDSRCPENARCVWAGDAAAVLKYVAGTDTLHTTLEPKSVVHSIYRIQLLLLSPYPKAPQPISQSEYVAKLVVTKN